jgi:hypothetical protein
LNTSFDWPYWHYFLFWVRQGCCLRAIIGCHFAGTCWEGERCSAYFYPGLAKQRVDWIWTQVWHLPGHLRCPQRTTVKCKSQKPDYTIYSNSFSLHSCDFQFMNNVTVKLYAFHVYILYINKILTKNATSLLQYNLFGEKSWSKMNTWKLYVHLLHPK